MKRTRSTFFHTFAALVVAASFAAAAPAMATGAPDDDSEEDVETPTTTSTTEAEAARERERLERERDHERAVRVERERRLGTIPKPEPATVESNIKKGPPPPRTFMHGFRVGYFFLSHEDIGKQDANGNDLVDIGSPHLFTFGYELTQRAFGGQWLNVITVQNIMISGINQNILLPTANVLLGFEFQEQFQIGVGANITPLDLDDKFVHMVIAAGYTPKVGTFNVPIHVAYVPDVDGHYRVGVTTGVNW